MKYLEYNARVYNEFKKSMDFSALKYDKKAVEEFQKEVDEKTIKFNSIEERLKWMIDNNYYENFLDKYTMDELVDLHKYADSFPFEFQSFMAINKFYKDYALKTNDKENYLENYQQRVCAVALHLAQGDINKAYNYVKIMMTQEYQPATPTFLNAGRARRGELVSCFLLDMSDSLNSIYHVLNVAAQLSKIGGGVAVNLTRLRARGEEIKGVKNATKGVIPVMKLLEDTFSYVDQMGQRQGSGVAYLNIFHYDIEEFLSVKQINVDEKVRMKDLSIGILIPNKFMELAKEGKPFCAFKPYSVYKTFGVELADMDMNEWYDKLVANPNVERKEIDAREFLIRIAKTHFESGYPFIVFIDHMNNANPLKGVGRIGMSNLCTEIAQIQTPSVITDYGQPDELGFDISCNLGSLNIANVMERKNPREVIANAVDMLVAVTDLTSIDNAPSVKKANEAFHSIGLGMMNLHGYLAKNHLMYESEEAREFADVFSAMKRYYTMLRNMEIAKERGKTFFGFEKSEYANGNYFKQYLENDYLPKSDKVKELFEGIDLPTREDWAWLAEQVKQHGLYCSYTDAIAPTGSISYVTNSTASVLPVLDKIERRTYGNSETCYPMPFLAQDTFWFYKTAYETDMFKMIDMVATIQKHTDQGISCTLFVNSDVSTRELARYYIYAWIKGLKSLYYVRTKTTDVNECISCAV